MIVKKTDKILCCCSGGKVRSVGAKYVLEDRHGCRKVIACGLEKNDDETLAMLFAWADHILVVGELGLAALVPKVWEAKVTHLNVGKDRYGRYGHPELLQQLATMIGT